MPCYDPRDNIATKTVYESGISPEDFEEQVSRNAWLEAALCAVCSELERRSLAVDILTEASRSGLVDLMDYWKQHSDSDEFRIATILHKYSKDEQAIMKKLLSRGE